MLPPICALIAGSLIDDDADAVPPPHPPAPPRRRAFEPAAGVPLPSGTTVNARESARSQLNRFVSINYRPEAAKAPVSSAPSATSMLTQAQ